jgi:hypothetical protein
MHLQGRLLGLAQLQRLPMEELGLLGLLLLSSSSSSSQGRRG